MNAPQPSDEIRLLKATLLPLLEDFLYWFDLAKTTLEKEPNGAISLAEQQDLLARVCQAEGEVQAMLSLFQATGGAAGVDLQVVSAWHRLVTECWQMAQKRRRWDAEH